MKRFLYCLALASAMLAGCSVNDYKQLEFKSCRVRSMDDIAYGKGTASADVILDLGAANPTRSRFELKELNAMVYSKKGDKVVEAQTTDIVVLEPKCDTILPVLLSATLFNPMATILGAGLNPETMTADIDATVKTGPFTKRIHKEKLPVRDIINKAGAANDEKNGR